MPRVGICILQLLRSSGWRTVAFVSTAFDDFYGFLAGWSLWIAELLALPVFAIAFVQYLQYLVQLNFFQQVVIKGVFLFSLTYINIRGVKAAGKLNDVLTIIKLSPLFLLVGIGLIYLVLHPSTLIQNYSPLIPLGLDNFGTALVLIFWAYVGFEMGTLPASEVKNPKVTIPKAITIGILIVTLFYLSTNFIVFGVIHWTALAKTSVPLVLVGSVVLGVFGAAIMSIGALVSVSGSNESGTLGTARLSYAMAIDGLFPRIFAKIHPKYGTPYMALLIQGVIAFFLSIYSGIAALISFSVFNMAFSFLLTCLALISLKRTSEKQLYGQDILPLFGIMICMYLIYSTSLWDKIVGIGIILIGVPIYIYLSPKRDIRHMKEMFLSEEAILLRRLARKERFLANFLRLIHRGIKWLVSHESPSNN